MLHDGSIDSRSYGIHVRPHDESVQQTAEVMGYMSDTVMDVQIEEVME
jgi:hypothetical protein